MKLGQPLTTRTNIDGFSTSHTSKFDYLIILIVLFVCLFILLLIKF